MALQRTRLSYSSVSGERATWLGVIWVPSFESWSWAIEHFYFLELGDLCALDSIYMSLSYHHRWLDHKIFSSFLDLVDSSHPTGRFWGSWSTIIIEHLTSVVITNHYWKPGGNLLFATESHCPVLLKFGATWIALNLVIGRLLQTPGFMSFVVWSGVYMLLTETETKSNRWALFVSSVGDMGG